MDCEATREVDGFVLQEPPLHQSKDQLILTAIPAWHPNLDATDLSSAQETHGVLTALRKPASLTIRIEL